MGMRVNGIVHFLILEKWRPPVTPAASCDILLSDPASEGRFSLKGVTLRNAAIQQTGLEEHDRISALARRGIKWVIADTFRVIVVNFHE
jgi:hypothetical protein